MDLIRTLLLRIENDPQFNGETCLIRPNNASDLGITDHTYAEVAHHLILLMDEGFVRGHQHVDLMGSSIPMPFISQLTWKGHEFLDDVRDPDIWRKAKGRAKTIASVSFGFIWEIAKAEIRAKLGLL